MLTDLIKNSIQHSVLCWLATVDAEGWPNVSPKEIFTYTDDHTIIIANIASPQSIQNIRHQPLVCVSFVNILTQKGYKIKGNAEIISSNDTTYSQFLAPLEAKTNGLFPFINIIKITINNITPILAPRYLLYPETTEKSQIESAKKQYLLDK